MNPNSNRDTLHSFLRTTFNSILKIQEDSLKRGNFPDLTLSKLHLIEEICNRDSSQNTMSAIAESLEVTVGTLTVAVDSLVKKGYIKRVKCDHDKRIVLILPTEKGILANEEHAKFHEALIDSIVSNLSKEDTLIYTKVIISMHDFFVNLREELKNPVD